MTNQHSAYRQILKATSIFGGVQIFVILIGMIKTKFVAVLLGTTGVGLMGLFSAPVNFIASVTGLGLGYSAVREVAKSHGEGDAEATGKQLTIVSRWMLLVGLLGLIVFVGMSPFLSFWAFGNYDYTIQFGFISLTLLLNSLSNGNKLLLQSFRMMKEMGKSTIGGALFGLITSIPLFFIFGLEGIVPSLVITAITTFVVSSFFVKRIPVNPVDVTWMETISTGAPMVKMGVHMMIGGIFMTASNFLLIAFISRRGGLDQLGLYNAGWSIVGQYIGIIFSAMTTDYFPRLAAVSKDDSKLRSLINQQGEIVSLVLTPLLILLIISMPLLIRVFYTESFLPTVSFVNWMTLGIFLKGVSWTIGFIFPAKGDTKVFLANEVAGSLFSLLVNIGAYQLYGLEGLGISFSIIYFFSIVLNYTVAVARHGFSFSASFARLFFSLATFLVLGFVSTKMFSGVIQTSIGIGVFLAATGFTLYEMDKRMDLQTVLKSVRSGFFGRKIDDQD